MIEEITQHPHFKERVEYVEYLFEQALSLEEEKNLEEIDHLINAGYRGRAIPGRDSRY